jgi:hypothetical protein
MSVWSDEEKGKKGRTTTTNDHHCDRIAPEDGLTVLDGHEEQEAGYGDEVCPEIIVSSRKRRKRRKKEKRRRTVPLRDGLSPPRSVGAEVGTLFNDAKSALFLGVEERKEKRRTV